jgi:predicted nucleic acid-binding protein
MNGKKWLLDTNIVIYLAKKELELSSFAKDNDSFYISVITYMECLGYAFSNKKDETYMTQLCNTFNHLFITQEVVSETINLRKKRKIKLPDAIIAAISKVENLIFVTNNTKDFSGIYSLSMINPIQIGK